MLLANPSGNGALINLELFSRDLLSAEEGNEVLINSVHAAPPYGNTHIVGYGNTDLQGYGSTRNTRRMEFKDRSPMAKLNLTEDQKTKIQAINKEYRDKQKDLNKAKRDEISSILTPEQQQMMKDNRKHFAGKDKPGKRHQRPNRTDKDIQ